MLSRTNSSLSKSASSLRSILNSSTQRNSHCSLLLWLVLATAVSATLATKRSYSQPLTTLVGGVARRDDNTFQPMVPTDISPDFISRNVFTKTGNYRVFEPVESQSDLRLAVAMTRNDYKQRAEPNPTIKASKKSTTTATTTTTTTAATPISTIATTTTTALTSTIAITTAEPTISNQASSKVEAAGQRNVSSTSAFDNELHGLEDLLFEYVEQFFTQGKYEPMPGLVLALQKNHTNLTLANGERQRHVRSIMEDANVEVNLPRALQSARLLFFAGLKKIMWPIYMGLQVLKSLLFALFLPTIIGSVSRLIGKGITSGSASSVPLFIRPMEPPQELDFRDNSVNFDDDNKFSMADDVKANAGYEYNAEASQQQAQYAPYSPNSLTQQTLSRYGGQQMQDTYLNALQSIGAASFKNSQGLSAGSSGGMAAPGMNRKPASPANMNTFQTFQKVPSSSLLLSNYDPFYSPLLSRLDSVFAQLKLKSDNESCREKLICLMYANPAKYAPYSNLVSAQLSRELNELRKPTSDNPDILRFFKYMRAAKDGQDGVDCEQSFSKCTEFKDFENPAMLSTYNDINKLVQARKMA